jgi:hypothetical protein
MSDEYRYDDYSDTDTACGKYGSGKKSYSPQKLTSEEEERIRISKNQTESDRWEYLNKKYGTK